MRKRLTLALLSLFVFSLLLGGCAQELVGAEIELPNATDLAVALETAALEVTEELRDDYATYFTPAEFQLMMDDYYGSFAGIGIQMVQDEEGNTVVYSVMPDRPAMGAGLDIGDIIVLVDGESVAGLDLDGVASRLRGDEGTDVEVTLLRETSSGPYEYTVVITRAVIESSSVEGQLLDQAGIAYIYIYDFTEKTPQEFATIFNDLNEEHYDRFNGQQIEGLILDLRSNGGGSFNAAIKLAQFFVADGEPIVWEKTYGGELYHESNGGGQLADIAVVCLQNGYTASASEVFIGALRDHGIAQIVGSVSYGKGITQVLEQLMGGGGLRYTQSRYYTPSHYDLHKRGLEPDVLVENEDDDELTYEDYFDPTNPKNLHVQEAIPLLLQRID